MYRDTALKFVPVFSKSNQIIFVKSLIKINPGRVNFLSCYTDNDRVREKLEAIKAECFGSAGSK